MKSLNMTRVMKYDRIIKFLSLAVLATGCAREAMEPSVEGNLEWIPVQLEGEAGTRLSVNGETGAAAWTAGDQVAVYTTAGSYTTCTLDVENSRVPVPLGNGESRDGYAVYPATSAVNNGTSEVQVTYPDTYDLSGYTEAALATLAEAPCPMVAVNTPGQPLMFRHVGGVLRIKLEGVSSSTRSIVITVAGPPVTGTATVTNPGTDLATSSIASGGHEVTFIIPSSSSYYSRTIVLNLPVPTGTYTAYQFDRRDSKDYAIGRYTTFNSSTIARAEGEQLSPELSSIDPLHAFSVADGKQVVIAPGNLQYIKSQPKVTFKFAEHPWVCLGTTTGQNSDATDVDRDLFGWATSGYKVNGITYYPYMTSLTDKDYGPAISSGEWTSDNRNWDWGIRGPISYNIGYGSSSWRTPTSAEWTYLFARVDANNRSRWTHATVAGVPGVILFPDDFIDTDNVFSVTGNSSSDSSYIIDEGGWIQWSYAGCTFLPKAGMRSGTEISDLSGFGLHGYYWSSTASGSSMAYSLEVSSGNCGVYNRKRHEGLSVRLIRELE